MRVCPSSFGNTQRKTWKTSVTSWGFFATLILRSKLFRSILKVSLKKTEHIFRKETEMALPPQKTKTKTIKRYEPSGPGFYRLLYQNSASGQEHSLRWRMSQTQWDNIGASSPGERINNGLAIAGPLGNICATTITLYGVQVLDNNGSIVFEESFGTGVVTGIVTGGTPEYSATLSFPFRSRSNSTFRRAIVMTPKLYVGHNKYHLTGKKAWSVGEANIDTVLNATLVSLGENWHMYDRFGREGTFLNKACIQYNAYAQKRAGN
jgi:hypothetical protein